MATLSSAETKIIVLIPMLMTRAETKPTAYKPSERAKINMVVVPGQGIMPAETISAKSVELLSTLQEEHAHVTTCGVALNANEGDWLALLNALYALYFVYMRYAAMDMMMSADIFVV